MDLTDGTPKRKPPGCQARVIASEEATGNLVVSIDVSCPQCGKQYKVSESFAGRTAQCKACGGRMKIPAIEPLFEAAPMPRPQPAPQAKPAPQATYGLLDELPGASAGQTSSGGEFGLLDELSSGSASPSPFDADMDDSASGTLAPLPKRKKKRAPREKRVRRTRDHESSGKREYWAIVLCVLGGMAAYFGYRERTLASLAHAQPQRMTLGELIANGPGDNIHIELSEVGLLPERAVIWTKSTNLQKETWEYIWIPAVSLGESQPGANPIKVLVGTGKCGNEAQVTQFCQQTTFTGMVVNATDSLKAGEREVLNRSLHGVDPDSCYLFRVGKKPTSGVIQTLLLVGGAVALLAGLGLGGLEIRNRFF